MKRATTTGSATRQVGISGPIGARTRGFRRPAHYYETEGYIKNEYLDQDVDPVEDRSARLRLIWEPSDSFTGDLRVRLAASHPGAVFRHAAPG